jgi:hypothetical protein
LASLKWKTNKLISMRPVNPPGFCPWHQCTDSECVKCSPRCTPASDLAHPPESGNRPKPSRGVADRRDSADSRATPGRGVAYPVSPIAYLVRRTIRPRLSELSPRGVGNLVGSALWRKSGFRTNGFTDLTFTVPTTEAWRFCKDRRGYLYSRFKSSISE